MTFVCGNTVVIGQRLTLRWRGREKEGEGGEGEGNGNGLLRHSGSTTSHQRRPRCPRCSAQDSRTTVPSPATPRLPPPIGGASHSFDLLLLLCH